MSWAPRYGLNSRGQGTSEMHISEGVLSAPVLVAGAALAAAGVAIGLKRLPEDRIVETGVLAAAFFVGSLIHVPVGVGSAHLMLNGLLGVLLGWAAFPAILCALALQGVLFQFGGLTTLGVNTFTMGTAAVAAGGIFRLLCSFWPRPRGYALAGFCGGFLGVALAALLTAAALAFTNERFSAAAGTLLLANLPVMAAEGLITMLVVGFLARVRPALLPPIPAKRTPT